MQGCFDLQRNALSKSSVTEFKNNKGLTEIEKEAVIIKGRI